MVKRKDKTGETLAELRSQLGDAVDELQTLADDERAFDAKEKEIGDLNARIARLERAQEAAAKLARPLNPREPGTPDIQPVGRAPILGNFRISHLDAVAPRDVRRKSWQGDDYLDHIRKLSGWQHDPQKHFTSLGEQLRAIALYYMRGRDPGDMDSRLVRAPTGAGEIDPSAGGFLVQTDFATSVFTRAYDMGELLSRVNKMSISTAANSIKIPAVDETSRATGSRWGGVQSYWVGEGTNTAGYAKPRFRLVELDLKKLLSLFPATDELLADTTLLGSIASQAFSEELMFMTELGIFSGSGDGQPLGVMNSPALVTQAKEVGQPTKTLLYENLVNIWSHVWIRSQSGVVWFVNQDTIPQLQQVSLTIGSAGMPGYLPPGGLSGLPYATLFGRPVIPIEYASTIGTPGDLTAMDLSQYVLCDKGGVQAASSMHVLFLTDEMVFRFIYRCDGAPIWHAPLTPFQGASLKSPFIALAQR